MNWGDLPIVLAIAEAGSLGGAAVTLGVDTSTVSRRLRALESQLAAKLFESRGRSQVPTAAGRLALEAAQEIGANVHRLEARLMGIDDRLEGCVRITSSPSMAQYALVAPIAELERRYPDIQIELIVTDRALDLLAREADVAVRVTGSPLPSLVGRNAGRVPYGVYASRAYLARHDGGAHKLVTWRRDLESPSAIARLCPDACVALRVNDLSTMVRAVAAGVGVALLPRWIGGQESGLAVVALDPTEYDFQVWVLRPPSLRSSARVRVLADHLFTSLRAQMQAAWAEAAPT